MTSFLTLAGLFFLLAGLAYRRAHAAARLALWGDVHGNYACRVPAVRATPAACATASVACGFLFFAATEWMIEHDLIPRVSTLGGWHFTAWIVVLAGVMLLGFLVPYLMLYRAAGRLR